MANHRYAFASLLFCSFVFAQNAPTTRPQPSPEQRALMEANWAEATDVAAPKLSLNPFNRDGTPNPNFGKIDAGWLRRHEGFLERLKQPVGMVFIGDSITDGWNGQKPLWDERFGKYEPANFGIGGDRTQHLLWRIEHGELDGISPKVVVVMIGTNNNSKTPSEIAAGTTAVVKAIRAKLPETKVLLLSIFPRGATSADPLRQKMAQANETLAKLDEGKEGKVRFFKLWDQFLEPDGTLTREIMPDLLHLSTKGYTIWADAIGPVLEEMVK